MPKQLHHLYIDHNITGGARHRAAIILAIACNFLEHDGVNTVGLIYPTNPDEAQKIRAHNGSANEGNWQTDIQVAVIKQLERLLTKRENAKFQGRIQLFPIAPSDDASQIASDLTKFLGNDCDIIALCDDFGSGERGTEVLQLGIADDTAMHQQLREVAKEHVGIRYRYDDGGQCKVPMPNGRLPGIYATESCWCCLFRRINVSFFTQSSEQAPLLGKPTSPSPSPFT